MLLKTAFRGGFFTSAYHWHECNVTFNYLNLWKNSVVRRGGQSVKYDRVLKLNASNPVVKSRQKKAPS